MLSDEELARLLKSCKGTDFADRRDMALILFLPDTGVRRGEFAAMTVDAVDLGSKTAHVVGKGRRPRTVAFGAKTARALDRYLRGRARHLAADSEHLWLGQRGPLGADGIVSCCSDAVLRPVSRGCMRIASGIPSLIHGWRRVATRAT